MTTRDLSTEIDPCPLWEFVDKDLQQCLATNTFCDINCASAWELCPTYEKLFEIFEDILGVKKVDEIELGTDIYEIKT